MCNMAADGSNWQLAGGASRTQTAQAIGVEPRYKLVRDLVKINATDNMTERTMTGTELV